MLIIGKIIRYVRMIVKYLVNFTPRYTLSSTTQTICYVFALNDDYGGGELYLPEYGLKIKPKVNTVVIFPGILSHQVLEITKGSRMAVITFFCNEKKKNVII